MEAAATLHQVVGEVVAPGPPLGLFVPGQRVGGSGAMYKNGEIDSRKLASFTSWCHRHAGGAGQLQDRCRLQTRACLGGDIVAVPWPWVYISGRASTFTRNDFVVDVQLALLT